MQCVLIKRMVEDLNLSPEVVICPTSALSQSVWVLAGPGARRVGGRCPAHCSLKHRDTHSTRAGWAGHEQPKRLPRPTGAKEKS